jgi:hypothetical protein
MESSEIAMYRGLGEVRNYGVVVLIALLLLNGVVLGAVNWIETSDLRNDLVTYMQTIPAPDLTTPNQTIRLPEDILSFQMKSAGREGFYETSIGEGIDRQDYLAYADKNKHYILMKSEKSIQKEIQSFALALVALYAGELVLLLGWWFFIRSKIREIFEAV